MWDQYRRAPAFDQGVWTLVLLGRLDPQDLRQRGTADLELRLVRLTRPDQPLQLVPGPPARLRHRRLGLALRPGEDLDGRRRRRQHDRPARERVRALDRALEQQRA